MVVFPMLAIGILWKFMGVLFTLVAILLILVILIQKGRGGGLSGAFGGGMASGLLGSKTGDFLTWVTIGLVGVFLLLAVLMGMYYRPQVSSYGAPSMPASQQSVPRGATPGAPTDSTPAPAAPGAETGKPAAAPTPAPQPPAGSADTNKPVAP